MIRIILINGQVCDEVLEFSFWDTIYDRYVKFSGNQMWDNEKDFIDDFNTEKDNSYKDNINRFIDKIPDKYKGSEVKNA